MGNNQKERLPFQAAGCKQRNSQTSAVAGAVAPVRRAAGDTAAVCLEHRGRLGCQGGMWSKGCGEWVVGASSRAAPSEWIPAERLAKGALRCGRGGETSEEQRKHPHQ